MKIRFVVDGGCDVPFTEVQRHNMEVIPLFVNYNQQSYADNGVSFDRQAYYEQLYALKPLPKTSAPSVELARQHFERALADSDHVFGVSIAASLSNSYNVMRLSTVHLPPERVTLIDSGQLSMGAGWQAIVGAEAAAQTGDIQAVRAAILRAQQRVSVYAALINVEFVRRGGRVSWAQAAVSNLLQIRPIVRVQQGRVESVARVRKHSVWVQQVAALARAHAPLSHLALLHTNNLLDLALLEALLHDVLPETRITVLATPSIGTHTGPGGIGVALLEA